MLDIVSVVSLAVVFALSLAYVSGCERLKGKRS
jgi:hypothetical protein